VQFYAAEITLPLQFLHQRGILHQQISSNVVRILPHSMQVIICEHYMADTAHTSMALLEDVLVDRIISKPVGLQDLRIILRPIFLWGAMKSSA
jgi:hypothetical protein